MPDDDKIALAEALTGLSAVSSYERQMRLPDRGFDAGVETATIVAQASLRILIDLRLTTPEKVREAIAYSAEARLMERRGEYPNVNWLPGGGKAECEKDSDDPGKHIGVWERIPETGLVRCNRCTHTIKSGV